MSDPRQTPVNDKVVARWLADRFPDRTAIDPTAHYVCRALVDLRLEPDGSRDRQLRYGDSFDVLELRGDLAFGIAASADYCGWVERSALTPVTERGEADHWVAARQTHAYSAPDLKSPERIALPHLAVVAVGDTEGAFAQTEAGWIPLRHLVSAPESDPVAVAERYLGADYLWGGNSSFGSDCSGLVQVAALACGARVPADSDQQAKALGGLDLSAPASRGDLFFWKGHVAIACDDQTFIHANAHSMSVAFEPIQSAIARIAESGEGPVTARGRFPTT